MTFEPIETLTERLADPKEAKSLSGLLPLLKN